MVTKDQMKRQFELTERLMKEATTQLQIFHRMSVEYYGFSYSDYDLEYVIDGIDYGSGISWAAFDGAMREKREEIEIDEETNP